MAEKSKKPIEEDLTRLRLFNASHFLNIPLVKPETLQLTLTNRCNFRCKMCTVNKYATEIDEEMPLEEIFKIIDKAKKQFDIKHLILTGGEPLLLGKKLVSVFEYASRLEIGVVLTTNGFFLEDYAHELTKLKAVHFHVSLDGLKATHNRIRGNPQSFDRAVAGLKRLVELRDQHGYGYSIAVAAMILKDNIDELFELYTFSDDLGVDAYDIQPYVPDNTNFSLTEQTALWPDAEDMQRFIRIFERISTAKTKNIKVSRHFDLDRALPYYQRKLNLTDWKCFAGYKTLFVTMSDPELRGTFEPCLFFCKAHVPLRKHDYDLKKIWYSLKAYHARRAIKKCNAHCYQTCFSLPSLEKASEQNSLQECHDE